MLWLSGCFKSQKLHLHSDDFFWSCLLVFSFWRTVHTLSFMSNQDEDKTKETSSQLRLQSEKTDCSPNGLCKTYITVCSPRNEAADTVSVATCSHVPQQSLCLPITSSVCQLSYLLVWRFFLLLFFFLRNSLQPEEKILVQKKMTSLFIFLCIFVLKFPLMPPLPKQPLTQRLLRQNGALPQIVQPSCLLSLPKSLSDQPKCTLSQDIRANMTPWTSRLNWRHNCIIKIK